MNNQIITHERHVWDALVSGDAAADNALLHDDFIGVYSDGFAARDAHIGQLSKGPTVASYTLHDITTKPLGEDHELICYRAVFQRLGRPQMETMYVSSIWQKRGNGWLNIFSQDTPAL